MFGCRELYLNSEFRWEESITALKPFLAREGVPETPTTKFVAEMVGSKTYSILFLGYCIAFVAHSRTLKSRDPGNYLELMI